MVNFYKQNNLLLLDFYLFCFQAFFTNFSPGGLQDFLLVMRTEFHGIVNGTIQALGWMHPWIILLRKRRNNRLCTGLWNLALGIKTKICRTFFFLVSLHDLRVRPEPQTTSELNSASIFSTCQPRPRAIDHLARVSNIQATRQNHRQKTFGYRKALVR